MFSILILPFPFKKTFRGLLFIPKWLANSTCVIEQSKPFPHGKLFRDSNKIHTPAPKNSDISGCRQNHPYCDTGRLPISDEISEFFGAGV